MSFDCSYRKGLIGESQIAQWFRRAGYNVLPVYEIERHTGKGPRLFAPTKQLIALDMLVFKGEKCYWVEAKHKEAFSWHRITERFVTGIDIRHYQDYCQIDDISPWPVWLLFLHRGGQAKDSPPSPSGLFGHILRYLRQHENHRHTNWGTSGMVYWAMDKLIKFDNPVQLEKFVIESKEIIKHQQKRQSKKKFNNQQLSLDSYW